MGGEGYITKDFFILEFYKSCWQYEIRFIFITLHLTSKITTCISSNSYCHWNQKEVVIHAPTRGATMYSVISSSILPFQSTLPQGERRFSRCLSSFIPRFQSTLPQGERLHTARCPGNISYFNPRSHKGSDPFFLCFFKAFIISIHAPTRGATQLDNPQSQHRVDFNPRSHKGSDILSLYHNDVNMISIHAPTRGAT